MKEYILFAIGYALLIISVGGAVSVVVAVGNLSTLHLLGLYGLQLMNWTTYFSISLMSVAMVWMHKKNKESRRR